MDIPKYNGTVNPDEWVKDVQTKCLINGIKPEKDVLKLCKLNIALSINLPNDINTLNDLVRVLKSHPTYEIYKNGCRQQLSQMKFEGGENATDFLANFRTLCDDAEITDLQTIKNRLLGTYPSNEFFKYEFSRRVSDETSTNDIFKAYSDVLLDYSKLVRYGPDNLIAIKHIETGRYLSSCETNYQTGSKRQVLFAGEKIRNENTWWYLTCEAPASKREIFQESQVLYDDVFYLTHHKTKNTIALSEFYKSPATGYAEANCISFTHAKLRFVKIDEKKENKKALYLKAQDKVNIKTDTDYTLRSQDETFVIEEKNEKGKVVKTLTFQEVAGHKEKAGRDDVWYIERK